MTALRPSLPLGLAYIAASLRKAGHEVSVLDAVGQAPRQVTQGPRKKLVLLGLTPQQIADRLDATADAFGITNMWSFSWPVVREICRAVKTRFPDKPLVAGGEHFTGLPEHSMQQAPIDFIVTGEGEAGAVELFAALQRGAGPTEFATIGNLWFRDGERPTKSPLVRARQQDVDTIPWPAWDLFDVRAYDQERLVTGIHFGMTVPILATRGCPYQCTYCSSPSMWTTKWYARDAKDVVDEIEHWHRTYGAINFPFHDLTAIVKKDWVVAFCRELVSRPFHRDIVWQMPSGTRVEVVDDEVAEWLHKTNGRSLNYAPESGSQATRKRIKKQMKDESLLRAVKAAVKWRLNVAAFFVMGFPEDTVDDLKQTVRLTRQLARLGITDVAFGFFFPIPNTELYRQLVEQGRIALDDDFLLTPIFANEARVKDANNYSYGLSSAQLTRWRQWALLNFYAVSFALRPWRAVRTLWHALRGRETSKMETFLVDVRRKLWCGVRALLGPKEVAAEPAPPVAAAKPPAIAPAPELVASAGEHSTGPRS